MNRCKNCLILENKKWFYATVLKGRHFSSDAEVIAAAETWLDGQPSGIFFEWLENLERRAKKCIELRGE
jgi:hypothetical protein